VALAAAAGVLLTSSLTSHGAALVSGPYLGIAADWLHFLGVAAWIGGLASLVFVLPSAVRATKGAGERVLARAVGRFSNLALVSVGVIVATGVFQAWLHVGSWEGLWQTAYGLSITAKVGILAIMLVLGAFNLLVARPRLAQVEAQSEAKRDRVRIKGASGGSAAGTGLAARLAWAVRGELLLGVLVLAVAAILTGLAPARDEMARQAAGAEGQAGPVDRRVDAQGLAARIGISPNSVGRNRFVVELPGTDPASVERVQLTLTYLDAELGSQPLVLQPSETARATWEAESAFLSQPGQWQAELLVRRANQDDVRTAVRFTVAGPGGAAVQTAPAAAYPLLPSPIMSVAYGLAGAGLLVVLVAGARWAKSASRRARNAQARLAAAGLMVLLSGGYVYGQEQRMGMPLDVANVRNPVPPDERSLAAGKSIYLENCAACHGETGRGDGPAGLRLVPRPADLRVHMAAGHTDGQLFYWVSYGVQGTGMPAWKDQLTEQQRWDAINFIRTFANPNAASGPASGAPPTQPAPATAVPTATVTPPPGGASPPGGAWAEVGHWRASALLATESFAVRGPWRIHWRMDSATESFQVMVIEGDLEPRLLAGAPGVTEGVFEEPRGGTFSLMFHNGIPFEVVVEDQQL
jgi:mono/diheme cytochrome c family protein/uncharacterized membrane protein